MKKLGFTAMFAFLLTIPVQASSLRELVRDQNIETYSVTRKAQDVYESIEGHLILTKYCYEYIYYEDVFFSGGKMYIVDSGDTCEVDKVYRK